MATTTLNVTNNDTLDLVVWIYDLNLQGLPPSQQVVPNANGAVLNQGAPPLPVQLQQDRTGNVSYHWAAEEITTVRHPRHDTGVFPPPAAAAPVARPAAAAPVAPLTLNIYLTGTGKLLPYMFRPYP
jgi:hypothetical protein